MAAVLATQGQALECCTLTRAWVPGSPGTLRTEDLGCEAQGQVWGGNPEPVT